MRQLYRYTVEIRQEPGTSLNEKGHERLADVMVDADDYLAQALDRLLGALPRELRDGLSIVVGKENG